MTNRQWLEHLSDQELGMFLYGYAGKVASYSMTEYAGDEVTIQTRSRDSCEKYYTIGD